MLFFFLLVCTMGFSQTRKAVSILGDSYSTFENYLQPDTNAVWYFQQPRKNNDVRSVDQTWWYKFIKESGYRLCVNNSFSGATICHTGYRKEDYSDRSFVTRMNNLGCPDLIFIFGATNDSWAGSPVGEYRYKDWKKADLYAFRPAFAYMLYSLQRLYPDTEVYCITNSELSDAITGSIDTICRHYGVKNIMLHDIHKQGGHPSAEGMESISRQVWDAISGN